ncbi:MAG TPA: DUF2285 domain-containing protein [Gammaproteobacteria bacterium]|nr:DUF2285 domain-containing protein [Gammaproteobacteria bacterium]
MKVESWNRPEYYDFTRSLDIGQWAWEFLRRNPEYQKEWREFDAAWKTLEARYGKPPERDFQRWKADPLAWRRVGEDEPGDCRVDQDKVLIECWLGARWGFYKFPLDPATDRPRIGEQLDWRPLEREVPLVEDGDSPYLDGAAEHLAIGFDLDYPLREQLERAKRLLQARQGRLRREGVIQLKRRSSCREAWRLMLRLLDGTEAGEDVGAVVALLAQQEGQSPERLHQLLQQARALVAGGYRELLRIPDV